jgi:hypothetical protein
MREGESEKMGGQTSGASILVALMPPGRQHSMFLPPLKKWHGRLARDPFSSVVACSGTWAIPA